jgi:hypothetical protein
MTELDTNIPLNFLSGKYITPWYKGTPISDLYTISKQTEQTAKEVADKNAIKDREEKVREALASALEDGVSLDEAARAVAKYDINLSYKLLKEFNDEKTAVSPENVRYRLSGLLSTSMGALNQLASNDPARPGYLELVASLRKELAADIPSMQRAFVLFKQADALGEGAVSTVPTVSDMSSIPDVSVPVVAGTTIIGKEVFRNGKESATPTDWFSLETIDGYPKPIVTAGADIANADSVVQSSYKNALADWEKNNTPAKKAATEAATEAETKAEIKKWVADFIKTYNLVSFSEGATKARAALQNAVNEFKGGNYATANLKVFKEVMGAMSTGEYSIATGSPFAAAITALPFLGDAIGNALAVKKFNSKEDAQHRIEDAIEAFNTTVSSATAEVMVPYETANGPLENRDAKVAALAQDGAYDGFRTKVGKPFPLLVPKPSSVSTTSRPPKPFQAPKAGFTWVYKEDRQRWVQRDTKKLKSEDITE